jgi:molecular chaperone DnaJ
VRGKVEMRVPAGTPTGKVFRLRGQGLPRLEGSGRGDQLVRVFVEVPKKLTSEQREKLEEFEELLAESQGKRSFLDRLMDKFS